MGYPFEKYCENIREKVCLSGLGSVLKIVVFGAQNLLRPLSRPACAGIDQQLDRSDPNLVSFVAVVGYILHMLSAVKLI